MEPLLNPPNLGDDWTLPETSPATVPAEARTPTDTNPDAPVDELPPDPDAEAEDVEAVEAAPEADDPDHESPPPPETDPAMTFADLKLIRPVLDAVTVAGYTHPT